jgi:hypothetical protein
MGKTTKFSVGKALEKLRGTDTPRTKMTHLDEKVLTWRTCGAPSLPS